MGFCFLHTIDLSRNKLSSCRPFQTCYTLQDLWLSGNFIRSFDQILPIAKLPKLRTIYLEYNPIYQEDDYRIKLQNILPLLEQIDAEECRPLLFNKQEEHQSCNSSEEVLINRRTNRQRRMKE